MSKRKDDDLFKDSVMSFGEHLNELRGCLWRAILGIALGVILGFFFADQVVRIIQLPLENALQDFYLHDLRSKLLAINPNATEDEINAVIERRMIFENAWVEPSELTRALGNENAEKGAVAEAAPPDKADAIKRFPDIASLRQIRIWKTVIGDPRTSTQSLSSQEAFMIWLKAALIVGLVISSPWVFYQVWAFVAAGLYPHERKYVYIYMPFSLGLFLFGVGMSLFVFKPMLAFFLSFNRSLGIAPQPRISEWLSFVMILPLGFGLAFQLPLVMLFMERIGMFTVSSYLKQWRVSVLVIWVIAAIVTPADPYSIFLLAVPMMGLFFFGIMLCKWWPREGRKELQRR